MILATIKDKVTGGICAGFLRVTFIPLIFRTIIKLFEKKYGLTFLNLRQKSWLQITITLGSLVSGNRRNLSELSFSLDFEFEVVHRSSWKIYAHHQTREIRRSVWNFYGMLKISNKFPGIHIFSVENRGNISDTLSLFITIGNGFISMRMNSKRFFYWCF